MGHVRWVYPIVSLLTNQCTRIAMLRFLENGWACGVVLGIEVGFADPQSRNFKRYMNKVSNKEHGCNGRAFLLAPD